MSNYFSVGFLDPIKKIPFIEGAKPVSFIFKLSYPEDRFAKPKNELIVKYQKNNTLNYIEILIHSPKNEVLKYSNLASSKSILIGGKNVYKDYDPKSVFFPSYSPCDLYTLITNEDVITIATNDQEDIKSIKTNRFIKLKSKAMNYANRIPDEVDDFTKLYIKFNKEIHKGRLLIVFSNSGKKTTEIRVHIFEDEKEIIEEMVNDIIICKKKINNLLMWGKVVGKDLIFYRLDDNGILVTRCTRGDKSLLTDFTKKIVQKIK